MTDFLIVIAITLIIIGGCILFCYKDYKLSEETRVTTRKMSCCYRYKLTISFEDKDKIIFLYSHHRYSEPLEAFKECEDIKRIKNKYSRCGELMVITFDEKDGNVVDIYKGDSIFQITISNAEEYRNDEDTERSFSNDWNK